MKKDFLKWHLIKSTLNERTYSPKFFKPKEIWYLSCGLNIGYEQDGKGHNFKRPVLIIKKFNMHTFWGIPLTSSKKEDHPLYFGFHFKSFRKSFAILSQLRLYDAKRLIERIGKIEADDFKLIKQKIRNLLK